MCLKHYAQYDIIERKKIPAEAVNNRNPCCFYILLALSYLLQACRTPEVPGRLVSVLHLLFHTAIGYCYHKAHQSSNLGVKVWAQTQERKHSHFFCQCLNSLTVEIVECLFHCIFFNYYLWGHTMLIYHWNK